MTQPVLLGGLFIGVLSALPVISVANCCGLWLIGGGYLAAHLAQQESPHRLTAGRGALLGLLAGLAGACIWLLFALLLDVVIAPLQERMVDEMLRTARDMPPNAREWLEAVANRSSSSVRWLFGFLFHLFGALFAALGGLLGAAMSRKDMPPALGGDPLPPPL